MLPAAVIFTLSLSFRFVVRWLGSSFAFLFGFVRLGNANVLPKALD
jgi:hypothetical protein